LTELRFFPNSPTFTGAGTPLGQLAACFVLPIGDDMGRKSDGIFQTLRDAALIQQTGGGNGFAFSRLRPKGAHVKSSAGNATGPVGFLRVYDKAFGEIAQGGSRRGANMGVLRIDHPDVEEFITCKTDENAITNFNISVGVTDAFMDAVRRDAEWELRFPDVEAPQYRGFDGALEQAEQLGVPIKVHRRVRARELFDKIVRQAHHNGEPGVLFLDAANRENPVPHLYQLEATNPCGEQYLAPYENCCLGSINLAQHVKIVNGKAQVDWAKLEESIVLSTHFLDNVVTANQYVPAVPQLKEAAHRARRIGLGIMGLGDLMYHLGVRYGGPEAQEFAAQVMEFVRYHCMKTSIGLARERGPFPAIEGSLYDPKNLKWTPPTPLEPYAHDWGRPPVRWHEIVEGIRRHGIRNAAQTTVAPTGTIATVAGCEAYGCEPVFALAYLRHVVDAQAGGDGRTTLTYASPLFEQALIGAGVDEATRERIYAEALYTGTCQNIDEVPESVRHTFVVSADITPEEHVRMQAAIQRFVDNSISKCVTGDTLVLTAQGLMPISELSELRLPDQFEPMTLDVITPSGIERADAFYYGGMRETRRVRLSYGYQVEGTLNHRIQILAGDGRIRFARLDELKVGDTVVLYGSQQVFGPAGQSLPQYRGEYLTNAKPAAFPERMSSELAYVLGCITSEGAIGRNGVTITNGDRRLLERLATLFERLFGLSSHINQDTRRESVYTLQVNSRALRNWLLADLGLEAGARNKIIPTCILRASRHEIAAFLRGLLLDGYMTRDGRMFGIGLASRELLHQLQALLLNFGVVSRIHHSAEHAWALTVSGSALERLAAFIEFDEVWKSDRIAIRNEGRQHRLFTYADLMPRALTESLRRMQAASSNSLLSLYGEQTREYQRARMNLLQGHRLDREMAATLYRHFSDAPDPYAEAFCTGDREGCLYVDVESIESGFSEVFDLSVPGSHTFVANGLGNHNTCNFPETATQDDVAKAYFLAWELGCKGLTVYVTGSRDKVVLETQQTKAAKEKPAEIVSAEAHAAKKPRPRKLAGSTYKIGTPLGTAFITVNENGDDKPFEVFLNVGKAGSDTAAVAEALGRLISLVLRLPSPMDPIERLQNVVEQLSGIGGGRPMGFGPQRVRSLPDGIAQALIEYLGQASESTHVDGSGNGHLAARAEAPVHQLPLKIGDLCPACGEAAFVNEEGCRKCYNCGHSEC
jgi:adenosylcobalamin-dependent ribonucleoside-diphosphate reductase